MERDTKGRFSKGKNIKDLTGMKFNRLTVIEMMPKTTRKTFWKCLCECGNEIVVRSDKLQHPLNKSCGCLKSEKASKQAEKLKKINTIHGLAKTPLYEKWRGMLDRCNDMNNHRYKDYGGRGIKVCEEWQKDIKVFEKWALENGFNEKLEIDRINVNGNYEPKNCRFVTRKVNCNNRRSNILIEFKGQKKSLMLWCEELNLKYSTIYYRYQAGKKPPELFQ